ncbi:hypothetical protein AJ80_07256 [Polytolypa hystricis UAMH7299]|uniref:DBF4-type domain-containing protein n=1 Tax=Polytolypa hystricis (strain UAMH7299) TaxID=1447883 RepID=A0A2B7XHE4_POLH7|nr:hypothetical protein AJ80_07256 [Polytolypa hystricis UAMH7299]
MSTRRAPLANVPNGTNSPHRAGLIAQKRPRPANAQFDVTYAEPPLKKQLLDRDGSVAVSPAQKPAYPITDGKVFTRKNTNGQPTPFERKLVAVREKDRQSTSRGTKYDKASGESLDSVRQWQKHYRKVFPQFVFYFEGIPEDTRNKCSRQIMALGATEEKFFSKVVTHVVTARPIPPELDTPNSAEPPAPAAPVDNADGSIQTVNPSLLEKNSENVHLQGIKSRNVHDKRSTSELKRDVGYSDVLYRARQMHMKIWALEKLQRVISTMNDVEPAAHHGHYTRSTGVFTGTGKGRTDNDLSQVLRNDRLNGVADHEAYAREIIPFKGPFIYIHDKDERTKPVMVRDYPKVAKRQDGTWPQFRSAPLGKCPFIDEPPSKKELDRQKAVQQEKQKKVVSKPKPKTAPVSKPMRPPERVVEKNAVQEIAGDIDQKMEGEETMAAPKQVDACLMLPAKPISPRKNPQGYLAQKASLAMYMAREPVASGIQPSNITSAIRSQMISSTAAAPGAKAGTSKEVHELKRKVLEKGNGTFSIGGIPSSHRTTDMVAPPQPIRASETRAAKTKAQEKLGRINEADTTQSDEDRARQPQAPRKYSNTRKSKQRKRDPKPGYCENCRDKFDDFEEHVMTRKHRKFALTTSNWRPLDLLLHRLQRPVKPVYDPYTNSLDDLLELLSDESDESD